MEKCLEGWRPEKDLRDPHSLTLVDIKCDLPRAGLGPDDIESLQLEKEDIGLSHPVILKDYLSPKRRSCGPIEVDLSQEDVAKCRDACVSGEYTCLAGKHPKFGLRPSMGYRGNQRKEAKGGENKLGYVVEFPPEDQEEESNQKSALGEAIQEALSSGLNHSLSLKRGRP